MLIKLSEQDKNNGILNLAMASFALGKYLQAKKYFTKLINRVRNL
jgi:hypothetical protein